uniref:Kelch repeat protein n=1 Tax=Globodera rostochiensis TaxID=31243 RepID=A0A914H500_GLORO
MGFLTNFPPFVALFRKKGRFRTGDNRKASLGLGRFEGEESDSRSEEENNGLGRRRVKTIGVTNRWLIDSYNKHVVRNNNKQQQRISKMSQKRSQPRILSAFEIVPVRGCTQPKSSSRRPEFCECCPIPRSGHRIFADSDFVYIIGGYNPFHCPDNTYTDVWRFNRLTQLWQKCSMALHLPDSLASFALANSSRPSECFIFGGTGVPFGAAASNELHRVRVDSCGSVHIQSERKRTSGQRQDSSQDLRQGEQDDELVQQLPPRIYGHAMCQRLERNGGKLNDVLYVAGGTTGHIYNMDIWRFERPFEQQTAWICTPLNREGFETGRYRLEITVHGQLLYTFGGGSPEFCAEFDEILAFNLSTNRFDRIRTRPDPEFGVPLGRKCHALVQKDNLVYIIGGCRDAEAPPQNQSRSQQLFADVWQFNMDTTQWTRIKHNLAKPVFFHSATITPDGCLFVFGGCTDEASQNRCNYLQQMWLQPPSLRYLASTALLRSLQEAEIKRINREGIRLSNVEAHISRILLPTSAA